MRIVMVIALAMMLALCLKRCEASSLRGLALPDEEEELRPRARHYRDYVQRRVLRDDDAFDDYGHLRFGRSED